MEHNESASRRIYKPLRADRDEFRQLILHPSGSNDATLRCELSTVAFRPDETFVPDSIPLYECLSYVWGQPVVSVSILLNGESYLITPRLAYILSRLRYRDQPRVLWVDALSINQHDVQERSSQVALIGKIYSHCRRDLAWLGREIRADDESESERPTSVLRRDERTELGMQNFRRIVQHETQTLQSFHEGCTGDDWECLIHASGESGEAFHEGTELWIDETQALGALFARGLWHRVWVVQELTCAPRISLIYEGIELEWDLVSEFLRDEPYLDAFHSVYQSHGLEAGQKLFRRKIAPVKMIEDQRQRFSGALRSKGNGAEGTHSTLLDAIARFKGKDATDPRDNVYALLGIVTENHGIVPDYSLTVEQVYQDATAAIINLSGNLDIICQNPCEGKDGPPALLHDHEASHTTGERCLSSWAAEFDKHASNASSVLFAQRDIFHAGTRTCTTPCRFSESDKNILVLRGTILDSIGPILQSRQDLRTAADILYAYLGEGITDATSHRQYEPLTANGIRLPRDTEPAIQAFWRTLTRDCTAPPGMRRLSSTEIKELDAINRDKMQTAKRKKGAPQTYCVGVTGSPNHTAQKWRRTVAAPLEVDTQPPPAEAAEDHAKRLVSAMVGDMEFDSYFTMSVDGLFLLVRQHAREGDLVAVLDGAKVPVVLRRFRAGSVDGDESQGGGKEVFHIVGPAYVHGFMDEEAEEAVQRGHLVKRDFEIA